MNTWQSGSTEALARNRATLEGMTAYLLSRGGRVGVYSTSQQWAQIVGSVPSTSSLLAGRDSWLAGASSLDGRAGRLPQARRSCPAAGSRSPSTCATAWTATTSCR